MLERTIPMRGSHGGVVSNSSCGPVVLDRPRDDEKGAGLACIAWALTNPEQELVFDEQFYAARAWPGRLNVKQHQEPHARRRHKASGPPTGTGRPIRPAARLAAGGHLRRFRAGSIRGPDRFKSELPTIFGGYDQWGNQTGIWRTVAGQSGEESARRCDRIDWYARLGSLHPVTPRSQRPPCHRAQVTRPPWTP